MMMRLATRTEIAITTFKLATTTTKLATTEDTGDTEVVLYDPSSVSPVSSVVAISLVAISPRPS
jgi:hypothetical protein